jgi:hypothetical protein
MRSIRGWRRFGYPDHAVAGKQVEGFRVDVDVQIPTSWEFPERFVGIHVVLCCALTPPEVLFQPGQPHQRSRLSPQKSYTLSKITHTLAN